MSAPKFPKYRYPRIASRPRWCRRVERLDEEGGKWRDVGFCVRETNALFTISGKASRFKMLPEWVRSAKDAEIEGEKVRKVWMTKPETSIKPLPLLTVEEVALSYLADRKPEWKPRSYEEAKWVIEKKLIPWFKENAPYISKLDRTTAWKFLDSLRESNPDGKRFSAWKRVIAVSNYALEKGYIAEKIEIDADEVDPEDEAGRCLSPRESARLEAKSRRNPTMHVIFLLGRYCGMRRREIEALEKSAVDLALRTITLKGKGTKTNKGRVIPIPDRVIEPLRGQIDRAAGKFVFPGKDTSRPITSCKTAWVNLKASAKVECRFQDLRVTSITTMCLDGVDSSIVAMIHGNTPQTIRDKYLKPTQADLLRLMNRTIAGQGARAREAAGGGQAPGLEFLIARIRELEAELSAARTAGSKPASEEAVG